MKQEYKKPEISTIQIELESDCLGHTWVGSMGTSADPTFSGTPVW